MDNKVKIKNLVNSMLHDSYLDMIEKVDKAINSSAIDTEAWDENKNSMILPKIITLALLENATIRYSPRGTSFERHIKKEVKNLKMFI